MTATDDRDDAVPTEMRFTVIDRHGDRVHLVSEDDGALYGHPGVSDEVWQAALTEVPTNWKIIDVSGSGTGGATETGVYTETDLSTETNLDLEADSRDLRDFAARKYELFLAFLGAGFERCEALTLVIETLHGDNDD